MEFKGVKFVEGYKCYNNPFWRVKNHPTLVFWDKVDKKYYFINYSTSQNTLLRDVLRNGTKPYIFEAKDVKKGRVIVPSYTMNIMVSIAMCDEIYVNTLEKSAECGNIYINNNYKCSNYESLVKETAKVIIRNINQMFLYNGNDDDYQSPDLADAALPKELIVAIQNLL